MEIIYEAVAVLFLLFGAAVVALIPYLALSWIVRTAGRSTKKTVRTFRQ